MAKVRVRMRTHAESTRGISRRSGASRDGCQIGAPSSTRHRIGPVFSTRRPGPGEGVTVRPPVTALPRERRKLQAASFTDRGSGLTCRVATDEAARLMLRTGLRWYFLRYSSSMGARSVPAASVNTTSTPRPPATIRPRPLERAARNQGLSGPSVDRMNTGPSTMTAQIVIPRVTVPSGRRELTTTSPARRIVSRSGPSIQRPVVSARHGGGSQRSACSFGSPGGCGPCGEELKSFGADRAGFGTVGDDGEAVVADEIECFPEQVHVTDDGVGDSSRTRSGKSGRHGRPRGSGIRHFGWTARRSGR